MAAVLGSERASDITGQSIAADGGWIRSLVWFRSSRPYNRDNR